MSLPRFTPHFRLLPLLLALGAGSLSLTSQAQSLVDLYTAARGYDATYQSAKSQYSATLARAEQAQAAIAALHADAFTADETDWVQIVEWYDELAALTDSPIVRLNRAVAVGEADGPRAGLAALAAVNTALSVW